VAYDFFLRPVPQSGTGSGAIFDNLGHIVTNYHVIEVADVRGGSIEVTLADKTKHPARIVGKDPNNDLAVLKIDVPQNRLSPIALGTSDGLQVGQKVLAIGNPYGLERTLTTGIISSLGRSIEAENGRIIEDVIQTDAAINPGNSGGPLLNTRGEIIGINTAIVSPGGGGNVGIGFSIPVDTVQRITKDLVTYGFVRRPYLGIRQNAAIALAEYGSLARRLRIDAEGGLLVVQVEPGSPAEAAGIRGYSREEIVGNYRVPAGGDVILAINGRAVNSVGELGTAIDRHKPNETVTVSILRDNRKIEIPVVLREDPRTRR
jgi:S1-C subfamily serine protease